MDMTYPSRDDCPAEFSLTRRKMIVSGALFAGWLSVSPQAMAQSFDPIAPDFSSKFMRVSHLLIDHHLDAEIGARMSAAMLRIHTEIEQDVGAIIGIAENKNATIVEEFFADIPEGRLKDTALAIISAWYTGVVDNSSDAQVFAFEMALMYQPTHDVMTIPTYAISRPNGWNAEAPPLGTMPTF